MNIRKLTYLLTLLTTILISTNTRAERILINDVDQTVTLSHALDCYGTPDIRVDTARPGIFEPHSKQLQAISDTVRAIVGYECPGLSRINITGSIRGLDGIVYRGGLKAQNDWLLQSDELTSASFLQY